MKIIRENSTQNRSLKIGQFYFITYIYLYNSTSIYQCLYMRSTKHFRACVHGSFSWQ